MADTPTVPDHLKKMVQGTVIDRGAYSFSGMGILALILSPGAAVFLARETDGATAFIIGGSLLFVAAVCFYVAGRTRRWSQRMLDEFVSSRDCDCDLCDFVKRTPNRTWAKRNTDS